MVHATFKKKPQKLRAEGGTPTKQSPDRTIVAASRGECRREPASKAKSFAQRAALPRKRSAHRTALKPRRVS